VENESEADLFKLKDVVDQDKMKVIGFDWIRIEIGEFDLR
jgi:hypothetical protein